MADQEEILSTSQKYDPSTYPTMHYKDFDVVIDDISEEKLEWIGDEYGVKHLSATTFPTPPFPVKGYIDGYNFRFMVPLVVRRFGWPESTPVQVWFLCDSGSPFTCLTVKTLEAFYENSNERTKTGRLRLPDWLKRDVIKADQKQLKLMRQLRGLKLATVCEEARCPNINECWGGDDQSPSTATIMLMGDTCTRGCRFCSVKTARRPGALDHEEPTKTATAVANGGAAHIAETIRELKSKCSHVLVEALVPDFSGRLECVEKIAESGLEVYAHNIETVRRLTPLVRDHRATYDQSLSTLEHAKRIKPTLVTKSSIMLGLGEADAEIVEAMRDLRAVGVEALTLGQYMQPTKRHLMVKEWIAPDKFDELKKLGEEMGFLYVASGPLMGVRVTGSLDRENGCYLAGENVEVQMELVNEEKEKDDVLAWICMQLHCDRVFVRGGKTTEKPQSNSADTTSVRLPKEAIYSSKPDIVLCNWVFSKGSKENRERKVLIPLGFPPTFKGHFVRYNWHIRIAVQRIDKPIQTLCLPLRVLNSTVNISTIPPTIENPFLRNDTER
ncbi:Lipoyl synthase, mitochondrial [Aphelenchoides besseyi]|nr:Lipoyl synthase, mitochondrial [Aphelenchoides besseyi]